MTVHLAGAWRCLVCDATGTGEPAAMDRAAEKHTKTTRHSTAATSTPVRPQSPEQR